MNKEQFIKIFKNKNNRIICLIFIIGVALMVIGNGCSISKTGGTKKNTPQTSSEVSVPDDEKRLAEILSQIDGAGEVSVMITYYSGMEKRIAYETKSASRGEGSEQSEDKKAVLTGGEPIVIKEMYPQVKGVIIIADGADIPSVKSAMSEAVSATLDVPAHRICIYKKGGKVK